MNNTVDMLNRIKLLMEYDLSMTYSENVEEQIILGGPAFSPLYSTLDKIGNVIYKDTKHAGRAIINLSQGNISDSILEMREFLFSDTGMFTDIVVRYAGAEFGGPYIMGALEFVCICNDFDRFVNNIGDPSENLNRVLEDIIFLSVLGLVFGVGVLSRKITKKSQPELKKYIYDNITFEELENVFGTIEPKLSKLGSLGDWAKTKISLVRKITKDIISAYGKKQSYSTAIKKTPSAMVKGFLGVKLNHVLNSLMGQLFSQNETPNYEQITKQMDKEIRSDNPWIKTPYKIEIKVSDNGTDYAEIAGKKYVFVHPLDSEDYSLKEIK